MLAPRGHVVRWRRLAGFLLVGLVLHTGLYYGYVELLQQHKAIRVDKAFIQRAPRHISVLFCGDSHPRTAIDGKALGEGVVNLAIGGEHYLKTWYRMRALVEGTNRRVDTLVLGVEAASFSSWHAWNFAPEYVWGRYVDYLEIGRIRGDYAGYIPRQLKASIFPYAGELRTLAQMRSSRFGFGDDLPTGLFSDLSRSDQRIQAMEQARVHLKDQELMDPGLKWAFARLVRWTRAHHIRLVLVAYPVTWDYWTWVARTDAPKRLQEEILDPVMENRPEIVRLDYHDRFFGQNNLFSDPHHLNPQGRARFTRILRKDLQEAGILPED